jgi:hypothetical protein
MSDTIKIELWNGEEIRIEPTGEARLFRDGAVAACGRFSSVAAAQRWADAILDRAAKRSPRAMCLNCEN